jgi:hypothetical protein
MANTWKRKSTQYGTQSQETRSEEGNTSGMSTLTTNTILYDHTAASALDPPIKKAKANTEWEPYYCRQDT